MSRLALPSEVGFDPRQEAIDRCQVALLRELASQQGGRLVLKGGMAMRAAFGSARLTKDIDFDRDPSLSQDALKRTLEKSLTRAASVAGISSAKVEFTKDSKTTLRARLQGVVGSADVRFDVEVSGRPASKANIRTEVVAPPAKYAMAPFPVTTYTNEALAATKIGAAQDVVFASTRAARGPSATGAQRAWGAAGMSDSWKTAIERTLMTPDSPSVMTTAMLHGLATTGREDAPSPATFNRWLAAMAQGGKLVQVIKGVYLNRLGHRDVSPAAAAHWVRTRSVVSLSWVLEQAFVTNNFGDTITCVIPTDPTWANPQIGDRQTAAAPFRFFAMPAHLVDERAGRLEDIRDLRFDYPRTTLEKALLDWIYLGASPRSRMTRPPFDIELSALSMPRLKRLAKTMGISPALDQWLQAYAAYQADPDVRENSATRLRL